MLRITQYIRETLANKEIVRFPGIILIWNLTSLCNLSCVHCYNSSSPFQKKINLSLFDIKRIIPHLKKLGVNFVILSGGEPLIRKDIFEIAEILKDNNIKTYLSTNGLLINRFNIKQINKSFDYLGVSIDGSREIHDSFRNRAGAFDKSLKAIRLALDVGMDVGLRYTLTEKNYKSLSFIFKLVEQENIPKIYISHLVYSGRGNVLKDLKKDIYLSTILYIVKKSFYYVDNNIPINVVTGNNEVDSVVLFKEFTERYPNFSKQLYSRLKSWGGNQAGIRLMNIDSDGNIKPDPFFLYTIGNVRSDDVKKVWEEDKLLLKLREFPRNLSGDCRRCSFLLFCNGNSRARSFVEYKNYFSKDSACYLSQLI